jgi:hypothetical protein
MAGEGRGEEEGVQGQVGPGRAKIYQVSLFFSSVL